MNAKAERLYADIYGSANSAFRADIPFYVEEAQRAGGSVLELGCRTGVVSAAVARSGVDAVGVDPSGPMLELARGKADELDDASGSLSFIEADLTDFSRALDGNFSLVICPQSAFLTMLTVEDQTLLLRNVVRHLLPGGRFIFDIVAPDLDLLAQDADVAYQVRDVVDPSSGRRFMFWEQSDYDHHDQIADVRTIAEELNGDGVVARRVYRDSQVRYANRWEVHHLLRLFGFEVLSLFGSFDREPFESDSAVMTWVAGARS
jgi:SAM-dependent methyltransferase